MHSSSPTLHLHVILKMCNCDTPTLQLEKICCDAAGGSLQQTQFLTHLPLRCDTPNAWSRFGAGNALRPGGGGGGGGELVQLHAHFLTQFSVKHHFKCDTLNTRFQSVAGNAVQKGGAGATACSSRGGRPGSAAGPAGQWVYPHNHSRQPLQAKHAPGAGPCPRTQLPRCQLC